MIPVSSSDTLVSCRRIRAPEITAAKPMPGDGRCKQPSPFMASVLPSVPHLQGYFRLPLHLPVFTITGIYPSPNSKPLGIFRQPSLTRKLTEKVWTTRLVGIGAFHLSTNHQRKLKARPVPSCVRQQPGLPKSWRVPFFNIDRVRIRQFLASS